MRCFNVTYDVIAHESAKHGDYAESGFVHGDGWHEALLPLVCGPQAEAIKHSCAMRLRQAVDLIGCLDTWTGGPSFYEADGVTDYRTGDVTLRALHCPDTITASSLRRVARLLGAVPIDGERHRAHAATFAFRKL